MQLTRNDDVGGTVLNCAVRYALGRVSYMPFLVIREIRLLLPDCSNKTLLCFEKDIDGFLKTPPDKNFGKLENREDWRRFLEAVRDEIDSRKMGSEESYAKAEYVY